MKTDYNKSKDKYSEIIESYIKDAVRAFFKVHPFMGETELDVNGVSVEVSRINKTIIAKYNNTTITFKL